MRKLISEVIKEIEETLIQNESAIRAVDASHLVVPGQEQREEQLEQVDAGGNDRRASVVEQSQQVSELLPDSLIRRVSQLMEGDVDTENDRAGFHTWPLYDTCLMPTRIYDRDRFCYFIDIANKNLSETNMHMSGQLPVGWTIWICGIGIFSESDPNVNSADLVAIFESAYFELIIDGCVIAYQAPLSHFRYSSICPIPLLSPIKIATNNTFGGNIVFCPHRVCYLSRPHRLKVMLYALLKRS